MTAPSWEQALTDLAAIRAAGDADLAAANAALASARALCATLTAQNAALVAQVAGMQPKPPARPETLFGFTPHGPQTWTGLAASAAKFGSARAARIFWPGKPAPGIALGSIIGSCKAVLDDAAQAAWQASIWRWTFLHEMDVKLHKGTAPMTLANWRAELARLAALPGGNHAGASVILSSWTFDPHSGNLPPENFLVDGVTHLGVDFDGMTISAAGVYPDLSAQLANVVAFTQAHGLTWGVAEFGCDTNRTLDPDGTKRAAWLSRWAHRFADAGAEYVCLWEWDSDPASLLTTPAEVAVWSSFVRGAS